MSWEEARKHCVDRKDWRRSVVVFDVGSTNDKGVKFTVQ